MADWQGIVADTTDVDETPGASMQQLNTRMRVSGELQRRQGFLAALPPMGGPILSIAGGNGFIVSDVAGGTVDGTADPIGVLIGPIVFPPVIQQVPQGNFWRYYPEYPGSASSQPYATCGGSITVTGGAFTPGTRSVNIFRGGMSGALLIDNRDTPANGSYTVAIPPSDIYPVIYVSPSHSDGTISFNGNSTPGCGGEWTMTTAIAASMITVYYGAIQNVWTDIRGALCPGKVRLTFSSVTAAGATAAVYRSDDTGGVTSIFDFRTIFSGMTYEIDVPSRTAANNLGYIRISIDPNGGTVTGTTVGSSLLGCV